MRVCMVTLDNPLRGMHDGISAHVYYLSTALRQFNCETWIVGLDRQVDSVKLIESEGLTYVCIPCRWKTLLAKMATLMKSGSKHLKNLEKEFDIDIFHGHGGYVGPAAYAKFTKGKKIMTLHTTFEEDIYTVKDLKSQKHYLQAASKYTLYPRPLLKHWRSWYFKKMDKIISVTKHNAEVTSKEFDLPLELFEVIYNGANLTEMKEYTKTPPTNKNDLLYYGRLSPRKGVQILLYTMPIILKEYPNLSLHIIGDGEYGLTLKKIATQLGISRSVKFLGSLNREELLKKISESTMVVIPSLYEGIPLTLFESAALGKPIITSSLPGICEVMTDEHTCLMSPPGDTKGLADSIMRLLSDENLRQEIGKNAKRIVEKNYTWDHIAEKTMKVYQKLLQ